MYLKFVRDVSEGCLGADKELSWLGSVEWCYQSYLIEIKKYIPVLTETGAAAVE